MGYPNGGVVFKNAAVGEIGSTTDFPAPTPEPTKNPTPAPSKPCFSNNYKDCLPVNTPTMTHHATLCGCQMAHNRDALHCGVTAQAIAASAAGMPYALGIHRK